MRSRPPGGLTPPISSYDSSEDPGCSNVAPGHSTIDDRREAQRKQRCLRLLETDLRKHVRRASELQFDYDAATAIARRHPRPPNKQLELPFETPQETKANVTSAYRADCTGLSAASDSMKGWRLISHPQQR